MVLGLQKFEISLDSSDDAFSPGEVVTGKIIADLSRSKSIRGLKVKIKGRAEVKWREESGSGKDSSTTWYTGNEEYFRMEYYLLGAAGNSERVEIQSGHHEIPFNFCLPHNIPSSFEHKEGSVRYSIKAVMDRPWKFDHQTTMSFTVETPYDINQCPNAMEPIEDEEHETFCCFPCLTMGWMRVHVYMPVSGFAAGDAIEAKIDIDNHSTRVNVTKAKLCMEQKIKLHATAKTKTHSNIVQKVLKTGPFDKKVEIMMNMQVPAVPSSNLSHCSIIDIEYRLNVEISVSGCHCSSTFSYPIIIGTRPALNLQSAQNTNVVPGLVQNAPNFRLIQPNAPTAPFLPSGEVSMPTSTIPFPLPTSAIQFPMPMGDQQFPVPSYGLEPASKIYPPQMPTSSTAPRFSYPPAISPPIGFVCPSSIETTTSKEGPEKPPPSYEACMKFEESK